jgi:hypothetical protein
VVSGTGRLSLETVLGTLERRPSARRVAEAQRFDVDARHFEAEAEQCRFAGDDSMAEAFARRATAARRDALRVLGMRA